jgi:hypothetical protein
MTDRQKEGFKRERGEMEEFRRKKRQDSNRRNGNKSLQKEN